MIQLWKKYQRFPVQMRASFWFLICSFLQKGISAITTPIFTRLLSTQEYGQFSVFNSWMGIITIFVTLNLSAGVYAQGIIKFENQRSVYSSSMQGLTVVLVSFWTVIYLLFHNFWNSIFSLTTVQMLAMLVIIWMSAVIGFWATEQRVNYCYQKLVCITLAVSLIRPGLGIFLVTHAQDKVTARILGIALVDLIAYAGLFIVQMRRGKTFYHVRFWKYALMFNLPLIPHYLSLTVLGSSDRIMIKNIVGESEAGIYSLAYSVSNIMSMFNSALMQTLSPWMYRKIKRQEIQAIAPVAYTTLILVAAVNLFLILLAPEVVAIFAPAPYYAAIWAIPPVAMSVYFTYSYDLFAKFAFYYEKTLAIMLASVAGAVLNIILNWIFIHLCGYIAAGYTTLVCYIVFCIGHYMFMNRICKTYCEGVRPYNTRVILKISVIFVVMGFTLLFTYRHILVRYSIVIAALIAVWTQHKRLINIIKQLSGLRNKPD